MFTLYPNIAKSEFVQGKSVTLKNDQLQSQSIPPQKKPDKPYRKKKSCFNCDVVSVRAVWTDLKVRIYFCSRVIVKKEVVKSLKK